MSAYGSAGHSFAPAATPPPLGRVDQLVSSPREGPKLSTPLQYGRLPRGRELECQKRQRGLTQATESSAFYVARA